MFELKAMGRRRCTQSEQSKRETREMHLVFFIVFVVQNTIDWDIVLVK